MLTSNTAIPFSVLLVDADRTRREAVLERFAEEDLDAIVCNGLEEALTVLAWHRSSVAVVGPPPAGGLAIDQAHVLRQATPTLRVILLAPIAGKITGYRSNWLHVAPADDLDAVVILLHRLLAQCLMEALASRDDRYRTLLHNANSIVVHLTEDYRIQDWNPAAEELYGYRRAEVLGRSYLDMFLSAEAHRRVRSVLEEVLAGQPRVGIENPAKVRDGTSRTLLWNLARLDNADGVPGVVAIGQDITGRKELEQRLLEAQRLQQKITETVPEHICLYDAEHGTLLYSNRKIENMLGWAPDDPGFDPDILHSLVEGNEVGGAAALLTRLTGEPVITSKHRTPDREGLERVLLARHIVFARGGGDSVRQVLCIVEDITEREKADEQLRKSREELRSLAQHLQTVRDEERSDIAREIHDQLGQQLTALKLHMSVLKRSRGDLDEAIVPSLDTAIELVTATTETVRRISRDLQPNPTAHLGLVPAIRWHAEDFARKVGIDCRFISDKRRIKLSLERETHVFRIVQETLTNVARHADATSVEIELTLKGRLLVLRIADDGRGISEAALGTGRSIGMTGMRERAHLCGGELNVFCAPGAGTIIVARIPMDDAAVDPKTGPIVISEWIEAEGDAHRPELRASPRPGLPPRPGLMPPLRGSRTPKG